MFPASFGWFFFQDIYTLQMLSPLTWRGHAYSPGMLAIWSGLWIGWRWRADAGLCWLKGVMGTSRRVECPGHHNHCPPVPLPVPASPLKKQCKSPLCLPTSRRRSFGFWCKISVDFDPPDSGVWERRKGGQESQRPVRLHGLSPSLHPREPLVLPGVVPSVHLPLDTCT